MSDLWTGILSLLLQNRYLSLQSEEEEEEDTKRLQVENSKKQTDKNASTRRVAVENIYSTMVQRTPNTGIYVSGNTRDNLQLIPTATLPS